MQDLRRHLEVISAIKEKLADKSATLMNLTISGSHLYGFTSKDSDIDYRGTFILNTGKLLSLKIGTNVVEMQNGEADIVLFELSKEIKLALAGNCNVLEHLNAKQIVSTAEYLKLKQLINNSWGKNGIYNSYKGMATFNYKKFILKGRSSVKKYLYIFRGLFAGIYALETGHIEPNVQVLNKRFKIPEVKTLIQLKIEGSETGMVPKELDQGQLERILNDLFQRIDKAYEKSKIPEKPEEEDVNKINEFLLNIRRDNFY